MINGNFAYESTDDIVLSVVISNIIIRNRDSKRNDGTLTKYVNKEAGAKLFNAMQPSFIYLWTTWYSIKNKENVIVDDSSFRKKDIVMKFKHYNDVYDFIFSVYGVTMIYVMLIEDKMQQYNSIKKS